jgi:hypothetical protein
MELYACTDHFSLNTTLVKAENAAEAEHIMYEKYRHEYANLFPGKASVDFTGYQTVYKPKVEKLPSVTKGVVKEIVQYS